MTDPTDELRQEIATLRRRIEDLECRPAYVPIPQAEPKREPPPEFIAWVRDNLPVSTIIANPDWWAPRLWRAAMHAHGITGDSNAE